jgi:LacI family gluconate utilization system Gnt-I transcriptional repressor
MRRPKRGGAGSVRPAAPKLADVARLAEVSEITVSRILRGIGPASESTRQRVIKAVADIGYLPNYLAGNLASATSSLIGVLIPSLSNIVFPEVLRGIDAGLAKSGIRPVVGITHYDPILEETLVGSLLAWKPAAMILAGFDHTVITQKRLQSCGVRVAELMDTDAAPIDLAVGFSHRLAGQASIRHLLARGYQRFGYVGHDWTADRRARLRWEGAAEALAAAGLGFAGQMLCDGPSSAQAGRAMLAQLLSVYRDIEVVVFSNDDMAVGGVFHCIASGIEPKRDLGLFGFNGLDIGQALPSPLSTIRSNRFRIGEVAVLRILAEPRRSGGPETIDTGFEIIEGATA